MQTDKQHLQKMQRYKITLNRSTIVNIEAMKADDDD